MDSRKVVGNGNFDVSHSRMLFPGIGPGDYQSQRNGELDLPVEDLDKYTSEWMRLCSHIK